MARCRVDTSIERKELKGFAFPLGVYPVEEMSPREGYACWFEPADEDGGSLGGGGGGGAGEDDEEEGGGLESPDAGAGPEWEEWPDRYVFDIAITASRLEALTRALLAALPGRVYPILDFLGHDAFREVDPYVSYDLIGQERVIDALRRYRGFFFEDGLVGFGAMSEEPFMYVFVDEHKIITVRVETSLKEKIESILGAFDLEEVPEIAGADSVTHEHRGVLDAPDDRPDLRNAEEIVEELIDEWGLVLNVDASSNLDSEGNDLGITGWRCVVRFDPAAPDDETVEETSEAGGAEGSPAAEAKPEPSADPPADRLYAEVFVTAGSLATADELAMAAARELLTPEKHEQYEPMVLVADRMAEEEFRRAVSAGKAGSQPSGVPKGGKGPGRLPVDMTLEQVWRSAMLA